MAKKKVRRGGGVGWNGELKQSDLPLVINIHFTLQLDDARYLIKEYSSWTKNALFSEIDFIHYIFQLCEQRMFHVIFSQPVNAAAAKADMNAAAAFLPPPRAGLAALCKS